MEYLPGNRNPERLLFDQIHVFQRAMWNGSINSRDTITRKSFPGKRLTTKTVRVFSVYSDEINTSYAS